MPYGHKCFQGGISIDIISLREIEAAVLVFKKQLYSRLSCSLVVANEVKSNAHENEVRITSEVFVPNKLK
jgi:hypothetical protein